MDLCSSEDISIIEIPVPCRDPIVIDLFSDSEEREKSSKKMEQEKSTSKKKTTLNRPMPSDKRRKITKTVRKKTAPSKSLSSVKGNNSAKKRVSEEGNPPSKKRRVNDSKFIAEHDESDWTIAEELSSQLNEPLDITCNVLGLLDQDNTIPFIARYRKEMTGNMDAAKLRHLAETYEQLKTVKSKINSAIQTVIKAGKMTSVLEKSFRAIRSNEELEHLYAPFKVSKKTLAEKARQLGLEPVALAIINDCNISTLNLGSYVNPNQKGLQSLPEVEEGVMHIVADIIAKNPDILSEVQKIFTFSELSLESKMNRNYGKKIVEKTDREKNKFELYYSFKCFVKNIQPHQVLAINRGENMKVLSVKILIPDRMPSRFHDAVWRFVFKNRRSMGAMVDKLVRSSINDAYVRFIEPLVSRKVRSELTKNAERTSVDIFAVNLRNLLMAAPVRGQVIVAVDPGFSNGCKIAAVAANGDVLHTEKLYLHGKNSRNDTEKLADVVIRYSCKIIAIGNGTACRETELIVTQLISEGKLSSLNVSYCIVNESGVSIYSVTEEAATELPDLEPNLRSAVSLARRIIDPLSEYVKVDPKHLGVGMYQHDISEAILKRTLTGVVEECVSFTGIDLNTCSLHILSKVAGLTTRKAQAIIDFRKANNAFLNREQLKQVSGIGPKTFEQCAGFLRIIPSTLNLAPGSSKSNSSKVDSNTFLNLLDSTTIHPESYNVAMRLTVMSEANIADIGKPTFIADIKKFLAKNNESELANICNIGIPTLKLITESLQREIDFDIRSEFQKPLFKKGVSDLNSVKVGTNLSGKVMNITTFGAFVDVGVTRAGLIHKSQINPLLLRSGPLSVGDIVSVLVLAVDCQKQRLSLKLMSVSERSQGTLG